jgi:hypothetical protein
MVPPHGQKVIGRIDLMRIEDFPYSDEVDGQLFILKTAESDGWVVGSRVNGVWSTEAGDTITPIFGGRLSHLVL